MRSLLLAAGLLLALLTTTADARMHAPYRGHRIVPAVAPLDAFAQPAGAYSFRRLRTAYAGPAIRIRRASDNAETDINFLRFVPGLGAPIDYVSANAHCAATSCFVTTWYDQSGNVRHLLQATPANQPLLVFGCQNGLPCHRMTGPHSLTALGPVVPSGALTASVVTKRSNPAAGACFMWLAGGGDRMGTRDNTAGMELRGAASTSILTSDPDFVFHATTGVISGASSRLSVDGAVTTGTVTLDTAGGQVSIWSNTGTCDQTEAVIWSNYGLTPAEVAVLGANQKSFWGTP